MSEPPSADLSRVAVVGTTCSGKTTFAGRLATLLDASHVELDALYWLPDWVERDRAAFRRLAAEAVAGDLWVVDGNYGMVRELIWPKATAVIWLNYAFPRVLWRGLVRTCSRLFMGEALFSGNRETFRQSFFSRDSILLWLATSYGPVQRDYRAIFDGDAYGHLAKIEFRRPAEAADFLSGVERRRGRGQPD